ARAKSGTAQAKNRMPNCGAEASVTKLLPLVPQKCAGAFPSSGTMMSAQMSGITRTPALPSPAQKQRIYDASGAHGGISAMPCACGGAESAAVKMRSSEHAMRTV
ncbi:MAG: hypothetical protein K2I95_05340, partial [Treponemataceae bacterium]|nr:hypothetical protein [Treponemataceae bacterium]